VKPSADHNALSRWCNCISTFISKPLAEAEAERRQFQTSPEGTKADGRIITTLVSVAVLLTLQHYLLKGDYFIFFLESIQSNYPDLAAYLFSEENFRLSYLMYWALGQTLLYVVIPVIQILFFFRQPLSDYGLKIGGFASLWWLYLAMLSVMVPIVLMVSQTESFQSTYPFYRGALNESMWPRFWIWESAYFLQFIGLEFFFRGYLLHGVKRRFGAYAIFVMMVPYCMIHFGKPMPETFAAIVAGVILGFMSLKTRSIWMGAALHVSVALTMDFCSLWRLGRFD
jgi:uncharacterized protein